MVEFSILMDIYEINYKESFPLLSEIPTPPKVLFACGTLPHLSTKLLTVVGSRKFTDYGKASCEFIISGLAGYNIAIVSGLALGIDTIAHRAALSAGLQTLAFPGSGLSSQVLYPRTNVQLAQDIITSGGALLSEYESDFRATRWSFPQRNRIMAGVSHAILVIEAEEKSGTRITARLATEYNRELGVVPGSIFNYASTGTNSLLKLGANPITCADDILHMLNIDKIENSKGTLHIDCTSSELELLDILQEPKTRNDLAQDLTVNLQKLNALITIMEIKGLVKEQLGKVYRV